MVAIEAVNGAQGAWDYVGSGSASARLQLALREVEQHVVHLRAVKKEQDVWFGYDG